MRAEVETIIPEERCWDLSQIRPSPALYVLNSSTPLGLSLSETLAWVGASTINRVGAINLSLDRIVASAVMARSGIKTLSSYTTGDAALLGGLIDRGNLRVWIGRGNVGTRVSSASQLGGGLKDPYGLTLPYFATVESERAREGIRASVIGKRAWGVELSFSSARGRESGAETELPQKLSRAAFACGDAFGLELYSVDFFKEGTDYFALDIDPFPEYGGIPEAPGALSVHIFETCVRSSCRQGR